MKKGQISFVGSNPMELTGMASQESGDATDLPKEALQVGETIKAYLKASQQLLAGKYLHLQVLYQTTYSILETY